MNKDTAAVLSVLFGLPAESFLTLEKLIQEIQHESYNEGFDDGVASVDSDL